jgi:putative glycosyltransferase (TIGR04372 family)
VVVADARVGGRRVLIARPDGSSLASLSTDIAEALARARMSSAVVCFVPPQTMANEALFELISADVPRIEPGGLSGRWLRTRWRTRAAAARLSGLSSEAGESFWREMYRELRRHLGDDRLPYAFRVRLRGLADRWLARSSRAASRLAPRPLPRRALSARVPTTLTPARLADAERLAAASGIPTDRPIVALECRSRLDLLSDAVDALVAEGYHVVRFGDPGLGVLNRRGAIDVTHPQTSAPVLDLYVLLKAAFVICDSTAMQRAAHLTCTPCLRLNAIDPFSAYPVRDDGLFTLAEAVELSTGRAVPVEEMHSEPYLKHLDHFAYRPRDARHVLEAVREMVDGVRRGWADSAAQAAYRARIVDVGQSLRSRVPIVRAWGPDEAFIGDGRLARMQAEGLG